MQGCPSTRRHQIEQKLGKREAYIDKQCGQIRGQIGENQCKTVGMGR